MINFRIVLSMLGMLLLVEGCVMLISFLVALIYSESLAAIFCSSFITVLAGFLMWVLNRNANKEIGKREGYIIVSLGWVLFSLFGCLPFLLSQEIPSFTDAYFETISGFTTTGASILNDIEALPNSLLFWRSMTQWLGGMGIIVMSLAILPILGIGGMQLFIAEVPGPTKDKIHPRIKETAKRLWGIYILFTFIEVILLFLGGMDLFDAINHSFTTMATGGYSTKQDSIAFYDSVFIQYVITIFMFIAGTNFTLSYLALHLKFKNIFRNEEFRYYLGIVAFFTITVTFALFFRENYSIEESFRLGVFQVVSIVTTTGFASADYLSWLPFIGITLFICMFIGGSAGSTGGGVKVVRVLLFFKNSYLELERILHPNALVPVRFNEKPVSYGIVSNIIAFVSFYLLTFIVSFFLLAAMGSDLQTSAGAVAATIGNIGPGIGDVGPVENYSHFSGIAKWFLSFLMLVGRLEIFTVLILLTPAFWRK